MIEKLYDPGPFLDEAVSPDGRLRPEWAEVIERVAADIDAAERFFEDAVASESIDFGKEDEKELFRLDPVPRLIDATEWSELEVGLAQRARALNALLADVYGEGRIISEGVIPERVVETAEYFEPELRGLLGPRAATVIGFDLVRGADGRLVVLEDNTRTPSGATYALAARRVSEGFFHQVADGLLSPEHYFDWLGQAFREAAPEGVGDPVVIVLSDGPDNSAWYEHVQIAERLGLSLVRPGDVSLRGEEVCFRDEEGALRRADVVARRTNADRAAEPGSGATWVGELLLGPLRRGTVRMVNTFGSGLADDKLVYAYVPEAIRFYLAEEPLIGQIPTLDPSEAEAFARIEANPRELVVKPRFESGGIGIVIGSQASDEELTDCLERVRAAPQEFIAQETVRISTAPTVADGAIEPRHVDLRAFAVCVADGVRLMPGGLTRVALERGSLVVNSSQGGGGKDTWVFRG